MDLKNNDSVPVRRRTQSASAAPAGTRPARTGAAASGASVSRSGGEHSTRTGARMAPPVRNAAPAARPAARSTARPTASRPVGTPDYHQRVRARAAASGYSASATARPSRPASGTGTRRPAAPRTQSARARYSRRDRNPGWATALVCVCVIALLGVGYVGINEVSNYMEYRDKCAELEQETFYKGITLEGQPLGGLTYFDAVDRFQKQLTDVASTTSVTVNARGKSFVLDSSSVQMSTNMQTALSLAYATGRTGSFDERYDQLQRLKANGMNFTLNRGWNESTLRAKIDEIAKAVYVKGQDADVASFDPETETFMFVSEVMGYELDKDDLYRQITQAIANGNINVTIEAKVNDVVPTRNVDYMREHYGRISYAQTKTTSNGDRNKNIQLASSLFNGMRVEPGQTVSFNKTTGERTERKGYRAAGAYSGGVFVEEPGGGVCQVSTTLYNAVAKADLEIVDRSPHSRKSDYVPIGLDAAVNWPSQDFAFKNNTDYPIYIVSSFAERKLTFKVYGKQMDDGKYIMLESEKTDTLSAPEGFKEKYDSTLPLGTYKEEAAREGYKAISYKVYYDANGNELDRVKLANSTYPASQMIMRIGTGN